MKYNWLYTNKLCVSFLCFYVIQNILLETFTIFLRSAIKYGMSCGWFRPKAAYAECIASYNNRNTSCQDILAHPFGKQIFYSLNFRCLSLRILGVPKRIK